jgi:hypothetical protein
VLGRPPETLALDDVFVHVPSVLALAKALGGTEKEWYLIFLGVLDARLPDIEEAFTLRVMEATA